MLDSNGDFSTCLPHLSAVAHALKLVHPERSTLRAIMAVLFRFVFPHTLSDDDLCARFDVKRRQLDKFYSKIRCVMPLMDLDDRLRSITTASDAIHNFNGEFSLCKSYLRAVAISFGAKRIDDTLLTAIITSIISIVSGLKFTTLSELYPAVNIRTFQKWKRNISSALDSAMDNLDF